jgi:hypothetical protein
MSTSRPPTEQADLDDGDVDGRVGEPAERRRRARLEVRRAHAGEALEVGDRRDLLGERLVVDRHAVAGQALVDALEVGRRVRADLQALGHQQAGDHLRRRALAVRARDVDHRVGVLRVAHRRAQPRDAVEGRRLDAAGLLVRRVVVEVRQRVAVVHGAAGSRGVSWRRDAGGSTGRPRGARASG